MAGPLNSRGVFRIADLFKFLMTVAMLFAFMPSLLRLGGSRMSFSYIYIILCLAILFIVAVRDSRLTLFYLQLARQNKLLFGSIITMFLLHFLRYAISPGDGPMSRTLMALIVFSTVYFYFSFLFYRDADNLQYFYRIASLGLVLNLVAIVLYANGIRIMPNYYDGYDRYSGLYSHPNQLAIVVSSVFVFYVSSYFNDTRLAARLYWLGMFFLALVVSVLAGSKTNILVSAVVMLTFMLWSVSRQNALIVLLSMVLLVVILAFTGSSQWLLSLNPRLFSVVAELSPDNIMQYRTIESRMEMWVYSWHAGMSYPFFGEGWASLILDRMPHSHNLFMDYLRVFGPPGLLAISLFLLAIVSLFSRRSQQPQHQHLQKASKLSILAYLLANMLSDSMGPQTVFFLAFFVAYLSVIPGRIYTFRARAEISSQNWASTRPTG